MEKTVEQRLAAIHRRLSERASNNDLSAAELELLQEFDDYANLSSGARLSAVSPTTRQQTSKPESQFFIMQFDKGEQLMIRRHDIMDWKINREEV